MSTMTEIASRVITTAHKLSRMSWAAFDYALCVDGVAELDMAIGVEIDRQRGPVTEGVGEDELAARRVLGRELWAEVSILIEQRKAVARIRGFVGWSNASTGPIRFAS